MGFNEILRSLDCIKTTVLANVQRFSEAHIHIPAPRFEKSCHGWLELKKLTKKGTTQAYRDVVGAQRRAYLSISKQEAVKVWALI